LTWPACLNLAVMVSPPALTYSPHELRTLSHDEPLPRPTRKTIFSHRLWRPGLQRLHAQRCQQRSGNSHSQAIHVDALKFGCVNARSVASKSALICQLIADHRLDVLLFTETRHERSESVSLKRVTPAGSSASTLRDRSTETNVHSVDLQTHGGLALVCRDSVKVSRTFLDVETTTFEYLLVRLTVGNERILVLGIYRPGSQAASSMFFDELSSAR